MTTEDYLLRGDNTPAMQLYRAVTEADLEKVSAFLDQGLSADTLSATGDSILQQAADMGHIQVARLLIERGANVNFQDSQGYTALSYAADENQLEIVELLLDAGADMNASYTSNSGILQSSILQSAAELGHLQVVRLLIERGANVNFQDDEGYTALIDAAEGNHVEVIDLLLDAGADMAALGGWGAGSALHAAAREQHIEMVRLLLNRGADPNIEDMDGETASYLQHFFASQRPPELTAQILELLTSAGATSSRRQERLLNSVHFNNEKANHI